MRPPDSTTNQSMQERMKKNQEEEPMHISECLSLRGGRESGDMDLRDYFYVFV